MQHADLGHSEVEVDEVDGHGFTPLMWASHYGQLPTARLLLHHRAKVNIEVGTEFRKTAMLAESLLPVCGYYDADVLTLFFLF